MDELTEPQQPGTPAPSRLQEWQRDASELWRSLPHKGLFAVLLVAWVALFQFLGNSTFGYKDTPSLFGWMQYTYSQHPDDQHGSYIPWVVLALLWWKRKALAAVPKTAWWPSFLLVVVGLLLHLAGFLVQQTRVSIAAFFIGMYGLTGLVWGAPWLRATFFPYLLFVFCVPLATISDTLTLPLRMSVTTICVGIAHALGIDVVRNGSQIFDAAGTFRFDVATPCSGLRSLTALVALTTIYAFMNFRAAWKRVAMLVICIPLAVLGNVARITAIIVVAQAFGMDAGARLHESLVGEFIFFAIALICVLGLGHLLGQEPEGEPPSADLAAAGLRRPPWAWAGITLGLVGASAAVLAHFHLGQQLGPPGVKLVAQPLLDDRGRVIGTNQVFLPIVVGGAISTNQPITDVEYGWLPKDTTYGRRGYFGTNAFNGQLSVVLMGTDRTSIHKPEYCVYGQGWVIERRELTNVVVPLPHPYELPLMRLSLRRSFQTPDGRSVTVRGIYAYWFVDGDKVTADHQQRMWWMARDLLRTGTLQRWAYVTCYTWCLPEHEADAFASMRAFLAQAVPKFQTTVPAPAHRAFGDRNTGPAPAVSLR